MTHTERVGDYLEHIRAALNLPYGRLLNDLQELEQDK